MQEIKIGKKPWIVPVGIIGALCAIAIGAFFFDMADNSSRAKAIWLIYVIAIFLIGVGIFALVLVVREFFSPTYLTINEFGIENPQSFGKILWGDVMETSKFEGTIGSGKSRIWVNVLILELKEIDSFQRPPNARQRFGTNYAFRNFGSPAVIYASNWAEDLLIIEENIQTYLTAHRNKSKGKQ